MAYTELLEAEMARRSKAISNAHLKCTTVTAAVANTSLPHFDPSTMLNNFPNDGFVAQAYLITHHPTLTVNYNTDITTTFVNSALPEKLPWIQ